MLVIKKQCNIVLQSSKHEGINFHREFFVCLPCLSSGRYCQKISEVGRLEKNAFKGGRGEDDHIGDLP